MKKCAMIAMAALLISAAVPAVAQNAQEQAICNISAKTCLNKAEILQKRIKKLNAEIKKGNKKYLAEEMKNLEQKLQDAMDQLDKVEAKALQK
jgi:Skp family chaperone for outer membrane proteins